MGSSDYIQCEPCSPLQHASSGPLPSQRFTITQTSHLPGTALPGTPLPGTPLQGTPLLAAPLSAHPILSGAPLQKSATAPPPTSADSPKRPSVRQQLGKLGAFVEACYMDSCLVHPDMS